MILVIAAIASHQQHFAERFSKVNYGCLWFLRRQGYLSLQLVFISIDFRPRIHTCFTSRRGLFDSSLVICLKSQQLAAGVPPSAYLGESIGGACPEDGQ